MGKLTLEDIRPYLQGVKQRGDHITAACPLCGKAGHLHIDEKGGTLLLYCQKCNTNGADLLKEFRRLGAKHEEPPQIDYKTAKPIEDYYHIYRLPTGAEQFRKRRRKWADGHKQFTFEYTDAQGKKQYKMPPDAVILYNLDALDRADASRPLYIVEGEKCVDAMTKQGLLATTSRTGAQKQIKFTAADAAALQKFTLKIIIPDNDEKGTDYAAAFKDYACKVLHLKDVWADCPKKGDIADYFAAGGKVEAITGYEWAQELTPEYIATLDVAALTEPKLLEQAFQTPAESRSRVLLLLENRARELGTARSFSRLLKGYRTRDTSAEPASENRTKFTGQPLALRCGEWSAGDGGIYRLKQQGDIVKKEYASVFPILPIAILENREDGTEKVSLSYALNWQQGKKWRTCCFPRSVISNTRNIVALADYGIDVTSDTAKLLVNYLRTVITANQDILPRISSISHLGWYEKHFIPYDEEISIDTKEEALKLIQSIHDKGTLTEWVKFIEPLFQDSIYLRLVVAACLASVLIEKCSALPFVLHLWGGSGTGKTVALKVAASVWGNPENYTQTINMTPNALMQIAGILHSLPLLGDELQTIKSNITGPNYDKLIMQLTEGTERGRLNSNSQMKQQRAWRNAFIFTGEEPITQSNSGGGVKNRVIELECTEKIIANGNAVVNFIASHYGSAGRAFIDHIANKDIAKDYQQINSVLLELTQSSEKQAGALALIGVADAYACECLFPNTEMLSLKALAKFAKSIDEIEPAERAYDYIMNAVAANKDNFTHSVRNNYTGTDEDAKTNYGEIWGKIRPNQVIFIKSRLEQELAKQGFSFDAVKAKWARKGYLVKNAQGKYIHKDSVNGVKFYSVRLNRL